MPFAVLKYPLTRFFFLLHFSYVGMKKGGKCMKNANISFLSLPNAVIGNLSLRKKRDPRYRLSGMTRAHAFTLIELLVVVLIIGILSAVALPQYQVAVMKSRFATLMPLVRSIKDAQEIYYLTNNSYATSFEELDVEVPGGGETQTAEDGRLYKPVGNNIRIEITPNMASGALLNAQGKRMLVYQIYYEHIRNSEQVCHAKIAFGSAPVQVCKSYGGSVRVDNDDYVSYNMN